MPINEGASNVHLLSIVITVKNEASHIAQLLESLFLQEPPFEIILIDSFSTDATLKIAERFERSHPGLMRIYQVQGHRGAGRNFGARMAKGSHLVFTDGDCVADSHWLSTLRASLKEERGGLGPEMGSTSRSERLPMVVAGKTVVVGNPSYARLERVELYQGGMDVTYPSCNLVFNRSLFEDLGGFDERFITAEDIDLNLRAVQKGAIIRYEPKAVIYHKTRMNLLRFLIQAFWNGYGRKQLTEKHGHLWSRYRFERMFYTQFSPLGSLRLMVALTGYFARGRRFPLGQRRPHPIDEHSPSQP